MEVNVCCGKELFILEVAGVLYPPLFATRENDEFFYIVVVL